MLLTFFADVPFGVLAADFCIIVLVAAVLG